MHILHLAIAVFEDKPGGSRQYAREVTRCQNAQGHRISFLVPRLNPDLPQEECLNQSRILRYSGKGPFGRQFALQRAFRRLHATDPVDAVMVHFAYTALGYYCLKMSRKIPTLRIFHGPWDREAAVERVQKNLKNSLACWTMFAIERYSLQRSHHIVALSEFMATDVIERYGISRQKVTILPGGVDTVTFAPGDKAACRLKLDLPPDAFLVFTARRLAQRMGLDLLIEAAALTRQSIPNLQVRIAGKGPLAESLNAQIRRLHLEDCVQLLGFVPDALLPEYYRAADVFVLPTTALEGFGLVILEALACNTPVLGTPIGAIPEVLSRFDPSLVLPGASPEQIAQGLVAFYHQHQDRQTDYRAQVLQGYDWMQISDRLTEVLSSIKPAR